MEQASDALDVYRRQGIGFASGFGARPALLIVDFVNGFNDPNCFGGGNIASAIERTRALLAQARKNALPIAFTRVVYADDGSDASQIVPELEPLPGEHVVRKQQPSAFFATDLAAWLSARGVDTVLVAGCTTSGCVRASVIDSMSYNFRTVVVSDCVGDRALAPHEANLFDMGQKYADLMTCSEVVARLRALTPRREQVAGTRS
jgi:maleamate amidohydrolase